MKRTMRVLVVLFVLLMVFGVALATATTQAATDESTSTGNQQTMAKPAVTVAGDESATAKQRRMDGLYPKPEPPLDMPADKRHHFYRSHGWSPDGSRRLRDDERSFYDKTRARVLARDREEGHHSVVLRDDDPEVTTLLCAACQAAARNAIRLYRASPATGTHAGLAAASAHAAIHEACHPRQMRDFQSSGSPSAMARACTVVFGDESNGVADQFEMLLVAHDKHSDAAAADKAERDLRDRACVYAGRKAPRKRRRRRRGAKKGEDDSKSDETGAGEPKKIGMLCSAAQVWPSAADVRTKMYAASENIPGAGNGGGGEIEGGGKFVGDDTSMQKLEELLDEL
jgi:hypothetical protein